MTSVQKTAAADMRNMRAGKNNNQLANDLADKNALERTRQLLDARATHVIPYTK